MSAPQLSIVLPMLNESQNLPSLFQRLWPVLDGLDLPFEIIAIDDGSTDQTLDMLLAERRRRPELRVRSFARNYGQHAAVMAGFQTARGEWIVTLDADLQNPPEEIPKLVQAFRDGYDLVNTIREARQDTVFRRYASRLVNHITRRWSGIKLNDFGCMLRGYHRRVVEPMVARQEYGTFIPALGMLYARRPVEIHVAHAAREAGVSNYSLLRLLRLQLDLTTSFSLAPLRLLFSLGGLIAAAGVGFGLFLLVMRLFHGPVWAADGVFTLFAILFIFVGAQFVAFGLLGEYVGRIYQEVRARPTFLLRELDEESGEGAALPARPAGQAAEQAPAAGEPADQPAEARA
ncbi:MAG: glycosyltransferase [Planctomycetota bacterium]